jgi:hypothetical protein
MACFNHGELVGNRVGVRRGAFGSRRLTIQARSLLLSVIQRWSGE